MSIEKAILENSSSSFLGTVSLGTRTTGPNNPNNSLACRKKDWSQGKNAAVLMFSRQGKFRSKCEFLQGLKSIIASEFRTNPWLCRSTRVLQLLGFSTCSSRWTVALLSPVASASLHHAPLAEFLCCFWLRWSLPFGRVVEAAAHGLLGDCSVLSVFGRNKASSSADSPGNLLYRFAVPRGGRTGHSCQCVSCHGAVVLTSSVGERTQGSVDVPMQRPWVYGGELRPRALSSESVAFFFYVSVREWVFGFKWIL